MRKLSVNPLTGTQIWHDFDEVEQSHVFVTHYDKAVTQAVFDRNAQLAALPPGKEWRLARSIPPEVMDHWINDLGVNPYSGDPEMQKKVRKLYNDIDYRNIRITDDII